MRDQKISLPAKFVFNTVETIVSVTHIIIEVTKLGQNILDSLSTLSNDVIELIPSFFDGCKVLFDKVLVNIASINKGNSTSGCKVIIYSKKTEFLAETNY